MTKLPIPSGPGGLARRFQSAPKPDLSDEARNKRRAKASKVLAGIVIKSRKATAKKAAAEVTLTKAEKVAAWRKAHPEAFAAQKQRAAERRKAKETK